MIMSKTNIQPLDSLVGHELSSVEFVRDYIQFRFDGPCLTAITNPVVYIGDVSYKWGQPGYRDILCDCINAKVHKTFVSEGKELRLEFNHEVCVVISLKAEDYIGAEAATFDDDQGGFWVW